MAPKRSFQDICTENFTQHDSICCSCKHSGAAIRLQECGHLFHTRCISSWPLEQCQDCFHKVNREICIDSFDVSHTVYRDEKWSLTEEKYVECFINLFRHGQLPIPIGVSLRLSLSKLLNRSRDDIINKYGLKNFQYQYSRYPNRSNNQVNTYKSLLLHFSQVEADLHCQYPLLVKHSYAFWSMELRRFATSVGQALLIDGSIRIQMKEIRSNKKSRKLSDLESLNISTPKKKFEAISERIYPVILSEVVPCRTAETKTQELSLSNLKPMENYYDCTSLFFNNDSDNPSTEQDLYNDYFFDLQSSIDFGFTWE